MNRNTVFAVGAHSVTRAFKSHDVVHKVPEKLIPLSSLDLGLYSYFANASINIRKNDSKDGIKHSCYKNRSCCCCCDNLAFFKGSVYNWHDIQNNGNKIYLARSEMHFENCFTPKYCDYGKRNVIYTCLNQKNVTG